MSVTSETPLLPNTVLARCERLRLTPQKRNTNRSRGEHATGKGGTSTEFSDYRNYVAGDDVRFVDWNIFSRLGEPYLKLYQHEEEQQIPVILDASASMAAEGKFDLARRIAAAFGVIALASRERASCYAAGAVGQSAEVLPPCSGKGSRGRLMRFLSGLTPGGAMPMEEVVATALSRHRGKGVAVLISDFMTFGAIEPALNRLGAAGLVPYCVQVLSPGEIDPEVSEDIRLVDSETGLELDVSAMKDLMGLYQAERAALENRLATACRQRGGRFAVVSSSTGIEAFVIEELVRKGWAR